MLPATELTLVIAAAVGAAFWLGYVVRARVAPREPSPPPHVTLVDRPLTVVAGRAGEQLFADLGGGRVRLVDEADAVDPDLVVFPVGNDRRLEHPRASALLTRLAPRLASGATGLVLDGSTEGVLHHAERTAILHEFLRERRIPARHCVYVTQERGFAAEYRAHCRTTGIAEPVGVVVHDYWIWRALAPLARDGERIYRRRLEAFRARAAQRTRKFLSLNRTARPAKILFLLSLLRDGLWEAGHISFGGFREPGAKPRPTAEQLAQRLPGFADLIAGLVPHLDALDGFGRVLLGAEHSGGRLTAADAAVPDELPHYADSWFSIVTETEMRDHPSRITEKMLKPLLNFHPLVVFGNPGALRMAREYGFATFDDVVDEAYDGEADPRRRFDRAYAEVVRLCRLDEPALAALTSRIDDTLIFNARWGLTRMPTVYRDQREAALVTEILAALGRRPANPG